MSPLKPQRPCLLLSKNMRKMHKMIIYLLVCVIHVHTKISFFSYRSISVLGSVT
jgi:hypothetical protein